jgi:uncharacterized damage-inducible protein DinB
MVESPKTQRDIPPAKAASSEIGLLLGMLDLTTEKMRQELGEIPDEALVWQPYPNGHSIGAILIHVAACEACWLHEVAAGEIVGGGGENIADLETEWMGGNPIDQYAGSWPTPPAKSLSWYYGLQDQVRARTHELVRNLDADTYRTVTWRPDRECTVRWIIHCNIEHQAYHLGQAVLLNLARERGEWNSPPTS